MSRTLTRWIGLALLGLGLVRESTRGADLVSPIDRTPAGAASQARQTLTTPELDRVGDAAARWVRGVPGEATDLPEAFTVQRWLVYVAARRHGQRLAQAWGRETGGREALQSALEELHRALPGDRRATLTALEINLAHSFQTLPNPKASSRWSNAYRGLVGVEWSRDGQAFRLAPTQMIAQNVGFDRALEVLAADAGHPPAKTPAVGGEVRLFEAQQLLVELDGANVRTTPLFRGNTVVPVEKIDRPAVVDLAAQLARWLTTNLQPDGRMVYLYWPSRGEESKANNEIRQWMATLALTRLARGRQDPALWPRVEANVRHGLARSFRTNGVGLGEIVEGGTQVKLGAVALAGLALAENPRRADFALQEAALRRTVDHLWQTNGEFRTFLRPETRNDNVNFYPGEALLFWATLYRESKDPALLERILASLRFYRAWHLANRNPAFVPWHTQAYLLVWQETRSPGIRDWVFEMNDWLLDIQQWDSQREYPDTQGRFYDPQRPFGPPHASSTGVYLEGLADAWELARASGDPARQERYRRAIIRGIRSVRQLAFRTEADLFYVSRRDRVLGGVRTEVYDNTIRVDNVQHNLLALFKVLERFPAGDFRP